MLSRTTNDFLVFLRFRAERDQAKFRIYGASKYQQDNQGLMEYLKDISYLTCIGMLIAGSTYDRCEEIRAEHE